MRRINYDVSTICTKLAMRLIIYLDTNATIAIVLERLCSQYLRQNVGTHCCRDIHFLEQSSTTITHISGTTRLQFSASILRVANKWWDVGRRRRSAPVLYPWSFRELWQGLQAVQAQPLNHSLFLSSKPCSQYLIYIWTALPNSGTFTQISKSKQWLTRHYVWSRMKVHRDPYL